MRRPGAALARRLGDPGVFGTAEVFAVSVGQPQGGLLVVQVESGEPSRDPDTRGGLFAVGRPPGTANEPVQPAAQWIAERCHRGQRRWGWGLFAQVVNRQSRLHAPTVTTASLSEKCSTP